MRFARTVQWFFLGLASLGCAGLLVFVSRQAFHASPVPEDPLGSPWMNALEAVSADAEPMADSPLSHNLLSYQRFMGDRPIDGLIAGFDYHNRFVSTAALLVIVGFVGFALMTTAVATRRSGRFAALTLGGTFGGVGAAFWLFGFNLAYPGDFSPGGFFPKSFGGPFRIEDSGGPFDYNGLYTPSADFFYQTSFAMLAAMLVIGLAAGRYRTPLLVLAGVTVGGIGYALNVSWTWGGGWLLDLNAHDFAGSAMVHTLAGGATLGLVVLARLAPPFAPWRLATRDLRHEIRPRPRRSLGLRDRWLFGIGSLLILPLIAGANGGSVLAGADPLVASVLSATGAAIAAAILAALLVSIPLACRSRLVIAAIGGLAGWAAACGPADLLSVPRGLVLGALAGSLAALATWLLDKGRCDDPLGIVPITVVGGAIGVLAPAVLSPEYHWIPQLLLLGSSFGIGLGLAGTLGFAGWFLGLLWEAPEPVPATDSLPASILPEQKLE